MSLSGLCADQEKGTLLRIGSKRTRHPRMEAVEQPWVAVWERAENRRLREEHREKAYPRGERTLL